MPERGKSMGNVLNTFVSESIDGGVAYRAPIGSTRPTSATAALDAAYADLGTLAKNGFKPEISRSSTTVEDFDGADYVTYQDKYTGTFEIDLLDVDLESVKKAAYGDAKVTFTSTTAGATVYHVAHSSDQLPMSQWVFRTKSGIKRTLYEVQYGRVEEIKLDPDDRVSKITLKVKASRNSAGNFIEEYGGVVSGS